MNRRRRCLFSARIAALTHLTLLLAAGKRVLHLEESNHRTKHLNVLGDIKLSTVA
jgi:hypothetical protein